MQAYNPNSSAPSSTPIQLELINKSISGEAGSFVVFQDNIIPYTGPTQKAVAWQVFNNLKDSVKFIYDQKLQVALSDAPEAKRTDLENGKAYTIEDGEIKLDVTKPNIPPVSIDISRSLDHSSSGPLTLYFYRSEKLISKTEILPNNIIGMYSALEISIAKLSQPIEEGQEFDSSALLPFYFQLYNINEGVLEFFDNSMSFNPVY